MRWLVVGWIGMVAGLVAVGGENTANKVKIVRYDQLKGTVVDNKGKVVVVDFWSTSCLPCMKAFPHLVELHRKYGPMGLKVVSVNLDEVTTDNRADVVNRVQAFLDKQQASFTNVILQEPGEVLLQKLRLRSIPCVYVFNRDGKWRKFQDDDFDLDAVDRIVARFIEGK